MTGFDIAVLVVLGVTAVTGFMRGFVQEAISLAAWIFTLFAIRFLHGPLYAFLEPHIGTPSGASVLAFALLLLVPYAAIKAFARRLGTASKSSFLGPVDRVLGFGFGGVKGAIVVLLAFSLLALGYDTVWGAKGRPIWITQARTYPLVNEGSDALVELIAQRRKAAADAEAKALSNARKSKG